jgi:hypothetical protein
MSRAMIAVACAAALLIAACGGGSTIAQGSRSPGTAIPAVTGGVATHAPITDATATLTANPPPVATPTTAVQAATVSGQVAAGSAFDAAKRHQALADDGQFGPLWDELVPVQQALVPRDLYLQCRAKANPPLFHIQWIDNFKLLDAHTEEVTIPGTNVRLASTAMALSYTQHYDYGRQSQDLFGTGHEFAIDGQWRWALSGTSIDAYKSGNCPSSAA